MMGVVPLEGDDATRALSPSCEDTARRWSSANQEADLYQTSALPTP